MSVCLVAQLNMLPDTLLYEYEGLKRNTDYVVTWLVVNAESMGRRVDKHASTRLAARQTTSSAYSDGEAPEAYKEA